MILPQVMPHVPVLAPAPDAPAHAPANTSPHAKPDFSQLDRGELQALFRRYAERVAVRGLPLFRRWVRQFGRQLSEEYGAAGDELREFVRKPEQMDPIKQALEGGSLKALLALGRERPLYAEVLLFAFAMMVWEMEDDFPEQGEDPICDAVYWLCDDAYDQMGPLCQRMCPHYFEVLDGTF